jgi:hypothetical protein
LDRERGPATANFKLGVIREQFRELLA